MQMIPTNEQKFGRFTAALFDLDGTLVDTAPDLAAALNHCLAQDGHAPFAVKDMRSLVGHGAAALLKRGYSLRENMPLDDARLPFLRQRFLDFYGENICNESHPFEGVEATLESLRAEDVACGICTNKPHDMALRLIETLGWRDRFDAVIGGDVLGLKKPDPRHITELLGTMKQPAETSFFIGDSAADYDAAQAADIPTIIVRFGYSAQPVETYTNAVLLDHYDQFSSAVAKL
ncbi:MAG: HAD-IA family hydrolase [Pseudomonadota bacterium]